MAVERDGHGCGGIPFLCELGVEVVQAVEGRSRLTLKLEERHLNGWSSAHGGVIMAMLDAAMSQAGRSLYDEPRSGVTVEMKSTFIQPGGGCGAALEAAGFAYHRTTTLCFCEAELRCEGELVAKASGTFKFPRNVGAVSRLIDRNRRE
ncbi:MAG: PaaI family thioesterase [Paucimonas sp.]|jgi:uncharacterized protein (TIGR00369 family)|nr:PaaI family thioesterase [Paucimonas sp.]